jgi:hypothetical protein
MLPTVAEILALDPLTPWRAPGRDRRRRADRPAECKPFRTVRRQTSKVIS